MKKSSLVHGVSIATGIWSALALLAAWTAGETGTAFGFSQSHLFNDAIILQLIAISAGVCALYRRQLEREGISPCDSHGDVVENTAKVISEQSNENAKQQAPCCR